MRNLKYQKKVNINVQVANTFNYRLDHISMTIPSEICLGH